MSLMVAAKASGGTLVAKEGHHVGAPCGAIPKDEHLAPALVAQVHQLVAGATLEASEIEIARLECGVCPVRLLADRSFS
jgi:hypothetical protein